MKKWISTLLVGVMVLVSSSVSASTSFKDTGKHWAKSSIEWASAKKLVVGYPDGTFRPNRTLTEGEFIALWIRSFENSRLEADSLLKQENSTAKTFDWTDRYYKVATNYFLPVYGADQLWIRNKPVSRGQVAMIITASLGKNFNVEEAIAYLYDKGLSNGKTSKTIKGFDPYSSLTRAEAVQFINTVINKANAKQMLKKPRELDLYPYVKNYK